MMRTAIAAVALTVAGVAVAAALLIAMSVDTMTDVMERHLA
ncbi:MAG: hypothetical protein WBA00_11330 [Rhodococcus sp. (in: high G+C Gram-positive bacteria)]